MSRMIKFLMLLCLLVVGRGAFAQSTGTVTYVYTDPQGTPLAEADSSGNITATFDYTPYGATALGSPPNGPGYTGHVNDPETNLVYMQARYYDSATGRFLSTDPVGPSAANPFLFNRYAYAKGNPIVDLDPDGRDPCTTDCAARLKAADAAVASDGRFIVGMFGGPISGIADFVHGLVSGDAQATAEGAGSILVTAVPEGTAVKEAVTVVHEVEAVSAEATSEVAAGKETGSYTNYHESGKTYSGKGSRARSQVSAKRVESETGDKHTATDWSPAPTDREAFKQESGRIDSNGGEKSPNNYNKIASPGKKMCQKDNGC